MHGPEYLFEAFFMPGSSRESNVLPEKDDLGSVSLLVKAWYAFTACNLNFCIIFLYHLTSLPFLTQ